MLLFAVNTVYDSYWTFYFPALTIMVVGADLEFNVANVYVMSSMPPSQQSTAGGIFQRVTRLCSTIGLGVATAVFGSLEHEPSLSSYWDRPTQPYSATFWTCFAAAAVSIGLVPLMTIGTQGGKQQKRQSGGELAGVSERIDEKDAGSMKGEAMVAQALPVQG